MKSLSIFITAICLLVPCPLPAADNVPHPVLSITTNNGSAANTVLSSWTESQYTNLFTPRHAPRNEGYGFGAAVVSGDTGWSWSQNNPTNITSTPSGTLFPATNTVLYPVHTTNLPVMSGKTNPAPYYFKAGSSTSLSMVFNVIAYHQQSKRDGDLDNLAGAYANTGLSQASRDAYARRIAIELLDWGRWYPDYVMTKINGATFVPAYPGYVTTNNEQRASDHNGAAHEWSDTPIEDFDAIYDSAAITNLNAEMGFDVRDYIATNVFYVTGDYLTRVPVANAILGNIPFQYETLPEVARVLNRPDYIVYMDQFLSASVGQNLDRDGVLGEGVGYSFNYLTDNTTAATRTRDYFKTRPATNDQFIAISNRATFAVSALAFGKSQWQKVAWPNKELPSFGDTGFGINVSSTSTGQSGLLAGYGHVSIGAGTSTNNAIQVNQQFSGDANHMRSDVMAYNLWAFKNPYLENIRYYNGAIGRDFGEQMLAHNGVEIDRSNLSPFPGNNTSGNANLTLYEPGNDGLAMTELDGFRDYSSKASRYQRLMLLNSVDLAKPYVVDIFRVTGGTTHDYTLHGAIRWNQTWQSSFPLVTNNNPYPMLEGSETWNTANNTPYYGYWRNVSSNLASGSFQVTYSDTNRTLARDLKLWMTADPNVYNVYVGATPVPDRTGSAVTNFFNNLGLTRPSTIVRHRIASGPLSDLFVSVIEPMSGGVTNIVSVQRLPMTGSSNESCGLKITFQDGRVDTYLVNLRNPKIAGANTGLATVSTVDGQYSLAGRVGLHVDRSNGDSRVLTMNATGFKYPNRELITPTNTYYSGGISGSTRQFDGAAYNAFITTTPLPTGTALQNRYLSLTHGPLSSGTTNISEMYKIDQVVLSNSLYYVCFTNDHFLEFNNVYTVNGSGSDVWGTADQFNYACQPVTNDCTITAEVLSVQNVNAWSKAGVMIRETTANNSASAFMMITPTSSHGASLQCRTATGASTVDLADISGPAAPYWVRLVRSGNTFTGYYSLDGIAWMQAGSTTITMGANVTAGLAMCSHNNAQSGAATFDNISISSVPVIDFADQDVGSVGVAGSAGVSPTTMEQAAPLRTFTGSNTFEIAVSASARQISMVADQNVPPGISSSPISFNFGNLGITAGASLQVTAVSSNQTLIPNGNLAIGGSGTNRTLTITSVAGQTGSSLITLSVTDGIWTNSRSFNANVGNFAVTTSPVTQSVLAGNSVNFTNIVSATNGTGTVSFSVSGLPAGTATNFSPVTVTGAGTNVLGITTTSNTTPAGTYPLAIVATAGSRSSTNTVTLVVTVPPPSGDVWNGGGTPNGNWTVGADWGGTAPLANDMLFFAGTIQTATTNNYTAGTAFTAITFNNSAGAFTLSGNNVAIAGGITNNSASTQLISLPLTLNSDVTFNSGSALLTNSGVISGNKGFVKVGSGTLGLNAGNTFTGDVSVNEGTLCFNFTAGTGTSGGLGAATAPGRTIYVGTNATLLGLKNNWFGNATFADVNFPALIADGGTLLSKRYTAIGNVTLNNGAVMIVSHAGSDNGSTFADFQFRGTVAVGGSSPSVITNTDGWGDHLGANTVFNVADVTGDESVDLFVYPQLRNQSGDYGSAAGGLTKTGAGTMSLSGINVYTGSTTISAGTLTLDGAGQLGTGAYAAAITNNGLFVYNSSSPQTLSGALSGTGDLTLNSPATLTLAANNSYTGDTIVNAGVLALAGNGSITNSGNIFLAGATLNAGGRSDGRLNLVSGQTLGGNGTIIGNVLVNGTISPGGDGVIGILTNSGSSTLGANGSYSLDMADATGDEGAGWDFLPISGVLDIQSSNLNPFVIRLHSQDGDPNDGDPGAAHFGNASGQSWVIATASGGITNFAPGKFSVDSSAFLNDLAGGYFTVSTNGNSLLLTFVPGNGLPGEPPYISSLTISGNSLSIVSTNGTPGSWTLLQSTDLTLPLSQWQTNRIVIFDGNGDLSTNIPNAVTNGRMFYLLKQ